MNAKDDRREFARWPNIDAATVIAGGKRHAGTVSDVSANGIRIALAADPGSGLAAGAEVVVELPDMPAFRAVVVRADPTETALRFLDGPHYVFR